MLRRIVLCAVAVWLSLNSVTLAEDSFFHIRWSELKIVDGELPTYKDANADWPLRQRLMKVQPTVVLNEPGEAYLQRGDLWSNVLDINDPNVKPVFVALRSSAKNDVTGRLFMPQPDGNGVVALKFQVAGNSATKEAARSFQLAKIEHFERLLLSGNPGAAWFRHQSDTARKALGPLSNAEEATFLITVTRLGTGRLQRSDDFDRTYELFSGGRAVSENLQLDREFLFPRNNAADGKVRLDSITGITVKEIDWQPLIKDATPKLDTLASQIPADQHVLFFPTFAAALKVADEAKLQGTSILRHSELSAQDTHLVQRYERQLGLSLSTLGRLIGPKIVTSVAITGGDPYFASGTDVAVLFETPQPAVFASLLLAKVRLDVADIADAKPVEGIVDGIKYVGVRSLDRTVCSYIAELDRTVVVTNSLAQLKQLSAVRTGKAAAIATLPEFVFFRQRYQIGDASESALLFISDATIRRWCGPRWRIASSRRVRDAAVLLQLQATNLDAIVTGKDLKLGTITSDLPTSQQQLDVQLTSSGVMSTSLGRFDFLTPISELTFDTVTIAERDAYSRWRDGYQRNWSGAFDPIALRIGSDEQSLSADLSIMPLILNSEYQLFLQVVFGAKLKPDSGDPHDTLAHWVLAINPKSPLIQQANQFLAGIMAGSLGGRLGADKPLDPLGWLGESFSVYADRDEYWLELAKHAPAERNRKLQQDGFRLPVAARIEVRQPLKLALFLTAVRAFIQQSGPGLTRWDTLNHLDQPYVKVSSARRGAQGLEDFDNARLYYSTIGNGLVLTPNEGVIKRAIERELARNPIKPDDERPADAKESTQSEPAQKTPPDIATPADSASGWLGESMAIKFDRELTGFFSSWGEIDPRQMAQNNSWNNLPILNEWKRRFPDRDPVEVHRRVWGVELICPGGGRYVWNQEWQTMESTIFGFPGSPKMPDLPPAPLFPFAKGNFGITFELDGLRSRIHLERDKPTAK